MQEKLALDSETLQILVKERKSMLRMLTIVGRYGEQRETRRGGGGAGISTRPLLKELKANGLHKLLSAAQKRGYIHREKVKKPKGEKGNHLMLNHLTPKGERIVKTAAGCGLLSFNF
jgi:hypothetical protein